MVCGGVLDVVCCLVDCCWLFVWLGWWDYRSGVYC